MNDNNPPDARIVQLIEIFRTWRDGIAREGVSYRSPWARRRDFHTIKGGMP